jgi:hypothetical protein
MAKSKKREINPSDMCYDLVLSNMTLDDGESSGGSDLEFTLRKKVDHGFRTFRIQITDRSNGEVSWRADAAILCQVAEWFDDAAQLVELEDKKSKKGGLPQVRR